MMKNQFLPNSHLQHLIQALEKAGFSPFGPQVRDGVIVYDKLTDAEQLPWGIREHQAPGEYTLERINKMSAFSWANGPQAIKPLLFKPSETVWRVERDTEGKLTFKPYPADETPLAIIGARACDLAALAIQDQVFLAKDRTDQRYQQRRKNLLIIAVNCTYSSNNCFCVSAGTGPAVKQSFDLLMSEVDGGFVITYGSERGKAILDVLDLSDATEKQQTEASEAVTTAAMMQKKRIPLDNQRGLRDLLFANLGHARWEDVAERCLSCGNCTSVCPTCFCHRETEIPSLDGNHSLHQREWDSCFTATHSELAGKPLRDDTRKRFRQWLTHKVGSWFDQFDVSGCVGCGRCVTWCPVGIDLTEELAVISGESNIKE